MDSRSYCVLLNPAAAPLCGVLSGIGCDEVTFEITQFAGVAITQAQWIPQPGLPFYTSPGCAVYELSRQLRDNLCVDW